MKARLCGQITGGVLGMVMGSSMFAVTKVQAALIDQGHIDVFSLRYEGNQLVPVIQFDETAVVDGMGGNSGTIAPTLARIKVPATTRDFIEGIGGRPSPSNWSAIGVEAGESFWFLPQNNAGTGGAAQLMAPFAGVGFEDLIPAEWNGPIQISLTGVDGPGEFSFWNIDAFGQPNFIFSTIDGVDGADTFTQNPGTHAHFNWGFTAPGTYQVSVQFDGTHFSDGDKSASATYFFNVIPEPSVALMAAFGSLLMLVRRSRSYD